MNKKLLFQENVHESTESEIRNKITLIMFCCSIMVIYVHSFNLSTYNITKDAVGIDLVTFFFESFMSAVTKFAVPTFFTLSGFLFFRSFDWKKLLEKYKSRFKSLVIPYIFWCSFYYLFFLLCSSIPFIRSTMNATEKIPFSITEWIKWIVVDEYYTLWFLKNLIVFILLSPLIWLLFKNRGKFYNGTVLVILAIIISFTKYKSFIPLEGWLPYLVGCYFGINHKKMITMKFPKIVSVFALCIFVLMLILSVLWQNIVMQILFIVSFWLSLDLFPKIRKFWWMEFTFFTYVSHDFLLEIIKKVIKICFDSRPGIPLLSYILSPILTEILLILSAWFLSAAMPHVWNVLSGYRNKPVPSVFKKNNEIKL